MLNSISLADELCFGFFHDIFDFRIFSFKPLNYFLAFKIMFSLFELCFDIFNIMSCHSFIAFSIFELYRASLSIMFWRVFDSCSADEVVPRNGKDTSNPGLSKLQPVNICWDCR